MGIDTFTAVIERLETLGLLHDEVVINLYAIGEPFLNRDIRKVFSYLNEKGLKFAISTNASTPVLFEEGSDILRNLTSLIISLPGFSEESYKRVYGFQFNRIQNNIVSLVNNFRKCGFAGDARLVYHVYQFNIDEVYKAKAFAEENQIEFYPYYAILYEYRHVRDYLSDTLSYDLLKKASQELFLANIEKTISARTSDYVCEFFNMLLIDVHGDLKTCCQIRKGDPGYTYGNVFALSTEDIVAGRTSQTICKECRALGMDYYLSAYTPFSLHSEWPSLRNNGLTFKDLLQSLRDGKDSDIVLFGAGEFGARVLACLKDAGIQARCFADNSALKIGRRVSNVPVIAPADILKECENPVIVVTTVNYKRVMNQLSQAGLSTVYYLPIDAYPW